MAEISERKRIWGWYFFDWASQPYHTLLVTFIFGPYFAATATEYYLNSGLDEAAAKATATSVWGTGMTIAGLIIAFCAPVFGAIADTRASRVPWIIFFSLLTFIGAWGVWYFEPDGSNLIWGLTTFILGFIGVELALIFVNSQLPFLSKTKDAGQLSGSSFAFGYTGGLISLAIMLLMFVEQGNGKTLIGLDPLLGLDASTKEGTRFVGPFTAIWFAVFMIPYFLWVREVKTPPRGKGIGDAISLLGKSIANLKNRMSLTMYLGSSMFYRDALNGLYTFGGIYATQVLDWNIILVGIFGIVGGIAAALFSWLGGKFDSRFGPKPVIKVAIFGLMIVCATVVGMNRESFYGIPLFEGSQLPDILFFICGVMIGGFGGTLQSASRSLMVRHTDPTAPTESFGLYGLSGRATAFLAPALITLATIISGSTQIGVAPVILLFLIGLILLRWVKAEGDPETWSKA